MPDALRSLSLAQTVLCILGGLLSVTLLATGMGFLIERTLPRRRIFAVPLFAGQYRFELLGNAVFLAVVTAAFTAAVRLDLVRFGPSGALRNTLTFGAMLFGFQAYYYGLHRLMHTRPLVRFHRWHHRSHVTTPLTGQSVSAVEAVGWALGYVGLPWLFGTFAPLGFWGLVGYYAFNINGNIVGHANVEPTARASASRGATWFANAFVYHSLHHARWNGHYSFQAALMDRLFGTEWSDWPVLFERVITGHPLESLKVRGDGDGNNP